MATLPGQLPRLPEGGRGRILARLVLVALGHAGVSVATALLVKYAFDRWFAAGSGVTATPAGTVIAGLLAVGAAAAALRLCERIEAERLGQSYAFSVRMALYDRLGKLDPRTLQARSRGAHLLRFIGDLTALRQWVSQGLARLVATAVTGTGALSVLAVINLRLGAGVAAVLLAGAAAALLSGRRLRCAVQESRRRRARLAANVHEKITAMPVVQVFNQIARERSRVARQSRRLRTAMIARARAIGRLRAINEATGAAAMTLTLALGAHEFAQGRASAGTVVAALAVLGLLVPALRDLGRVHEYWHAYVVAREKIATFMALRPQVREDRSAQALAVQRGDIELRDVALDGVFEGLSARARAGSLVAITGPNGGGKSTLLSLVARLVDPDRGQLFVDGQDLARQTLASIRATVGMVGADLPLMRGSIERNVRYRHPRATAEAVAAVCRRCGIDRLCEEFPEGMQTRVVDGGVNLSLGQRQRIALARALLGDPAILLLDEADANLDATARGVFDRVLRSYRGTVLFATHRREWIDRADSVWRLENGRLEIVEPGRRKATSDQERHAA